MLKWSFIESDKREKRKKQKKKTWLQNLTQRTWENFYFHLLRKYQIRVARLLPVQVSRVFFFFFSLYITEYLCSQYLLLLLSKCILEGIKIEIRIGTRARRKTSIVSKLFEKQTKKFFPWRNSHTRGLTNGWLIGNEKKKKSNQIK